MSLPALIALVALLAGALSAGGAWRVQEWRYGAKEAERLDAIDRDRRQAEKLVDVAAGGHEADRERIRTEFLVITNTVEKVTDVPFYAAADAPACLDDAGVLALGNAIRGAEPSGQPPAAVPRPDPSR